MKNYDIIVNLKKVQQDIETTLVDKYCQNNPMNICEDITPLNQSEPFPAETIGEGDSSPMGLCKRTKSLVDGTRQYLRACSGSTVSGGPSMEIMQDYGPGHEL